MHWLKRKVKRKSGEKIFTLHLSMQRKHHKCKVLKVIGSEEKNKTYKLDKASCKNFLWLQQKQSDDVC